MPCDRVPVNRKIEITNKAADAIRDGRAQIERDAATLELYIEGLTAEERGDMKDACILSDLALQAMGNPALYQMFADLQTTPEAVIAAHNNSHK